MAPPRRKASALPFESIYRHGFARVAVATPRVEVASPAANVAQTIELARRAARERALLVVFPELGLSAYSNEDLFQQDALLDASLDALEALLTASRDLPLAIAVGLPLRADDRLFNCAMLLHRGRLLGAVPKSYLPNYREFYERRQFAPAAQALSTSLRLLGQDGMKRVADLSTLNANYLMTALVKAGFEVAYPRRRACHEFTVTLHRLRQETGVTAMDFAKRLLDKGFHAPTAYFPLLVPECLLIEPTETESKQTLDAFVEAMTSVLREAREQPDLVKTAPHVTPVRRLDEVRAARDLDLRWNPA